MKSLKFIKYIQWDRGHLINRIQKAHGIEFENKKFEDFL